MFAKIVALRAISFFSVVSLIALVITGILTWNTLTLTSSGDMRTAFFMMRLEDIFGFVAILFSVFHVMYVSD
jgi:hypothetical protein